MTTADLLAGPRGRRLCLEFAMENERRRGGGFDLGSTVFHATTGLESSGTAVALFGWADDDAPPPPHEPHDVSRLLGDIPLTEDPDALLPSLIATVDSARYWQAPDGRDLLLADPVFTGSLRLIGEHVIRLADAAWWDTPMDPSAQWAAVFPETTAADPSPFDARDVLTRWHAAQEAEEATARTDRPADPLARWSGSWWSKPPTRLAKSTRSLPGTGPVGLSLVEDGYGWESATVTGVEIDGTERVYEIDGADAWAALCGRFPIDVTASRRHDWFRTTGTDARWVIPDWARVAEEFDAVHLTVFGWLSTAGRAVPLTGESEENADDVDGWMTVLAGWDPDQTYWLTNVVHDESTRGQWHRDDDRWTEVRP